MKQNKVLKDFTAAKRLSLFCLILSFAPQTFSSEVAGTSSMPPEQFQAQRCDSKTDALRKQQNSFLEACSKAGLGHNIDTCKERLDDCSGSSSSEHSYCLNNMTTTEEADKRLNRSKERARTAEDKQDDLNRAVEDLEETISSLKEDQAALQEERGSAKQEYELRLAETEAKKVQAVDQERQGLETISDQIAAQNDEIDKLQLELQEFILKNEMDCRKKAEERRAAFIATERGLSASGRRARYSQSQLISVSGNSVNARGTMIYNKVLKACTSPYVNGKRTAFGSGLAHQKAIIEKKQAIINRGILRNNSQRSRVREQFRRNIGQMNQAQREAEAAYTYRLMDLNRKEMINLENQSAAQNKITGKRFEMFFHNKEVTTSQSNLRASYEVLQDQNASVSKSKFDAFNKAQSLQSMLELYEEDAEICERSAEVDSAVASTDPTTSIDVTGDPADSVVIDVSPAASGSRAPSTAEGGITPATSSHHRVE